MATHEDIVCLHGEGTYVTASGLACARCGELLSRDNWPDNDEDDRPDEWRENDWNGWPEGTPNAGAVPRRGSDVGTSPLLAVSESGDK